MRQNVVGEAVNTFCKQLMHIHIILSICAIIGSLFSAALSSHFVLFALFLCRLRCCCNATHNIQRSVLCINREHIYTHVTSIMRRALQLNRQLLLFLFAFEHFFCDAFIRFVSIYTLCLLFNPDFFSSFLLFNLLEFKYEYSRIVFYWYFFVLIHCVE